MTDLERAAMAEVLQALHGAMVRAQMPAAAAKVPKVTKTSVGPHRDAPGFLGRYRELVDDQEPDPVAILVALVRAKVAEHARRDGADRQSQAARRGEYCGSQSLTRETYWPKNLAAARVAVAAARRPAPAAAVRQEPERPPEIDGVPLDDHDRAVWDRNPRAGWSWNMDQVREARLRRGAA